MLFRVFCSFLIELIVSGIYLSDCFKGSNNLLWFYVIGTSRSCPLVENESRALCKWASCPGGRIRSAALRAEDGGRTEQSRNGLFRRLRHGRTRFQKDQNQSGGWLRTQIRRGGPVLVRLRGRREPGGRGELCPVSGEGSGAGDGGRAGPGGARRRQQWTGAAGRRTSQTSRETKRDHRLRCDRGQSRYESEVETFKLAPLEHEPVFA